MGGYKVIARILKRWKKKAKVRVRERSDDAIKLEEGAKSQGM